jgi:sortase (surface protein transpeptidase)
MGFLGRKIVMGWLIIFMGMFFGSSCDSGQKAIDEATGNRALKQYQKSKEDIKKIEEKQKERDAQIPNEEDQEKQENK